jgi:Arc/MetJ-type ribon-helix-helix transcriptional regulator
MHVEYAGGVPQLVTRIDASMEAAMDALVESGRFESRSEIVRVAVEALIDADRRRKIGEAIIEGYERMPETEEELELARIISTAMIEAEPWD